jgi:hypothetical protein
MAKPLIFAYYYLWYYGTEEKRWPTFNRDYPPALGFYRSDDPRVLYQHLLWADRYSIDGFLVEWFGTDTADGIYSDSNLALLRPLLSGFPGFRFAVFYDQAIRFTTLDFSNPDKREAFLSDMEKIALDNFSHPNYWRVGGRPVVVIYVTRSATGGYGNLIAEARERMARSGYAPYIIGDEVWWGRDTSRFEFYDAVTAFNLQNDQQVLRAGGDVRRFAELSASLYLAVQRTAAQTGVEVIPGIGHAYNDEIVRSNLPFIPTVLPGELPRYREDLIYVAEQMAALYAKSSLPGDYGIAPLFVNSFNEWPERSAVEPSAEIEAFNAFDDRTNNRRLILPAHGYAYLEGISELRRILEGLLL